MKADDNSLTPEQAAAVHKAAINLLDRSSAWGRLPVPINDLMATAELQVATLSAFDEGSIRRYIREMGEKAGQLLRLAKDKVLGILDVHADIVHIDTSVTLSKQTYLKLHEAGHKEIPHQKGLYRWIQDGLKYLSPETADLFEREANNFARIVLFQDTTFTVQTIDEPFGIKIPMAAARNFGASVYASLREYVRRHHKICAVIILEPTTLCPARGIVASVRRIETSPSFHQMFDLTSVPQELTSLDKIIVCVPIAPRRMSRPQTFQLIDRNGQKHEFVGEGFRSPHQTFVLIHAIGTLGKINAIPIAV